MTAPGGIASELVAQLAAAGTPPELLAAVARELFASETERRILAERRENERSRKAKSRAVTGQDVTACDTPAEPLSPDKSPPDPQKLTPNPCEGGTRAREGSPFPRPEWAEPQVWADFLANRKAKRLKNTATAYGHFLAELARWQCAEWPPPRLLEYAAAKGWGGIYNPREERENGRPVTNLRGSRPDPGLDLYKRGLAQEAAERGDPTADRGAWPSLPAIGTG